MCLTKKQKRAIVELILGLVLGVPSIEQIFAMIFKEQFQSGNSFALIGWITAAFVGIILFLDSIATLIGFKNLGDLLEYIGYEEDE
jgi:hypothetical protein